MINTLIALLIIAIAFGIWIWYKLIETTEDDLDGADYCASGYVDDTKES